MPKHKILIFLLFLGLIHAVGQPPRRFYATYGGDGEDIGYGVKETYNGQYIIIGSTTSYGNGYSDAYMFLVDSMGTPLWYKTFGGEMTDVGRSIVVNPSDSGYIFAGYSNSFGNGAYDVYVVRTDKHGELIWQQTYGGVDWDFGYDLVLTFDGAVIVCGKTYNGDFGNADGYLVKLDINSGDLMWQRSYGGSMDDEFRKIIRTSDNMIVAAGNTKSLGDINNDFWIVKIFTTGDTVFSKSIGERPKAEMFYDFIEDNDDNFILCGSYDTSYNNIGKNISYLIKCDKNGVFIKKATYQGAFTPDDRFSCITNSRVGDHLGIARKVYHEGGFFGIDIQPIVANYDLLVFYANTYGDSDDDEAFSIINTADDGFLLIGYASGFSLNQPDVFLLKLDFSLDGSKSAVGLKNYEQLDQRPIYYYKEQIFFPNFYNDEVQFQIWTSAGQLIQSGMTRDSNIEISSALKQGMYFIVVSGESNYKLRFVKE